MSKSNRARVDDRCKQAGPEGKQQPELRGSGAKNKRKRRAKGRPLAAQPLFTQAQRPIHNTIVARINSKRSLHTISSISFLRLLFLLYASPSIPYHDPKRDSLIALTIRAQHTTMSSDSDLTDLSSELSSVRSSPSPPPTFGYPSPLSSQDNSASVSDSQQESRKRSLDANDLPPAKKRRSVEAKPRRTVHLDLRSHPLQHGTDQTTQLDLLLKTLRKRRKIVVVAGAGISTSAGGE